MTGLSKYLFLSSLIILSLLQGCEKDNGTGTVTDIDGNIYQTITTGNQVWMAENLRTTRFNDGTEISLVTRNNDWHFTTEPALSWYNNDSSLFRVPYGALYNGYVAEDDRICPAGWHVPSAAEWDALISGLGGQESAGGKMKVDGLSQWHAPNTGASNSSGLSSLPAGMRYFEGTFSSLSYFTAYWSSTAPDTSSLYLVMLSYLSAAAEKGTRSKQHGFSIRCVRD